MAYFFVPLGYCAGRRWLSGSLGYREEARMRAYIPKMNARVVVHSFRVPSIRLLSRYPSNYSKKRIIFYRVFIIVMNIPNMRRRLRSGHGTQGIRVAVVMVDKRKEGPLRKIEIGSKIESRLVAAFER